MKKLSLLFLTTLVLVGSFIAVVKAQASDYTEETIVSDDSNIVVNTDNSVDVTENINYNTGPANHHGIFRDITPLSSQNKKMDISNISVTDEKGSPAIFTVSNSISNVEIKIGDPDAVFSGSKTYVIKYHATNAVGQLKDIDEIYWNATGNGWPMPILQASAKVVLPNGAIVSKSACYYGQKGSTEKCQTVSGQNGYSFSTSGLRAGEGMTVAVGFQKGIVTPYPPKSALQNFIDLYLPWTIAVLLPILTLIFSLLYWNKNGRDPKGAGTIIPQYDVPEGLTPIEVGGIVKEKIKNDNISAEIIYLATKGYLKIKQIEEKSLELFSSTDYELVRLKATSDLPNYFDQFLLNSLFAASPTIDYSYAGDVPESQNISATSVALGESVKLSDITNTFSENAASTIGFAVDGLKTKGYYSNIFGMKNGVNSIFLAIFLSICASALVGGISGQVFFGDPFPVILGIVLSIIIYSIVSHFFPAKTIKGVAARDYLLGLKDYLQIAEKDRLQFHNAPEKKPEVFEKLLPYAMVLGVLDIWAKEFEGIYTTPPTWYSGTSNGVFNAVVFSNSLSSFSSFASSSMTSSPGGGSGGGGFSGGGGGGGGGGSW